VTTTAGRVVRVTTDPVATTTPTPTPNPTTRATGSASAKVVPWRTVLIPAAVLCAVDTFWAVVLRGAVGAVGRGQEPYLAWARGSLLLLPLFTLAVLAALGICARRFGARPRGALRLWATTGLTVVAATLAGSVLPAVDTVYDALLENDQAAMMGSMAKLCTGSCLAHEQASTWSLQLRGLGLCALLMLVTNVVLVAWMLALAGGRALLATTHRRPGRGLAGVLASLLLASAVVHAAVVPEHLAEWWLAAAFFVALTVAQVGAAVSVWLHPLSKRVVPVLVVLVTVGPLILWVWSRTVGLPFDPDPGAAEAIGLPDVVSGILELDALAAGVALFGRWGRPAPTWASPHLVRVLVLGVVVATVVGLAGAGIPSLDPVGFVSGPMSSVGG